MTNLELHQIITADGVTYTLNVNTPARYLLSTTPSGLGLPPTEFVTGRTYQQDGRNEFAFYLEPRQFALSIGGAGCSRDDLWVLRDALLNVARPNRGGQLTYVFLNSQRRRYAIKARAIGLNFPEREDEWYEWGYQDELELEAIEPWFFDYDTTVDAGVRSVIAQLVFPITFDANNIWFGDANEWGRVVINYTGTWYAYPRIVIDGPASNISIFHEELGYRIVWDNTVASGDQLIIDLRNNYAANGNYEGVKIEYANGDNAFNYLIPDSNLLQFRIEPDGVVAGGVNTLVFGAAGVDSNTDFTVTYNTCFIGI